MTSFRMIVATALCALFVPGVAAAKEADVDGPMALKGAGFFKAELEMGDGDEQRPVRIGGRGGYVGFLDLGGDLEVRCAGKGRAQIKKTDEGTVFLCAGRVGIATARGSHFKLRGFAMRYRALLPEGVTGSFQGRFVERGEAGDGEEAEDGISRSEERKAKLEERKAELAERKAKLEERKARFAERKAELEERRKARGEKRAEKKAERADKKGDDESGEAKKPTLAELIELLKAQKDG